MRGQAFEYELLYDGDSDDGGLHCLGLIDVNQLYDDDRSGSRINGSDPGRRSVGGVSPTSRTHENAVNPSPDASDAPFANGAVHFRELYNQNTGAVRFRKLYNYFRTYDPTTGRYVQSDPIGLDGGLNTYAYALNNPITFFDPLELAGETSNLGGGTTVRIDNPHVPGQQKHDPADTSRNIAYSYDAGSFGKGRLTGFTDESGSATYSYERLSRQSVIGAVRFRGLYNYFRDYDSTTGRYVQSDPIGLAGGMNRYAYAGGSPLNHSDPFGLCPAAGLICGPVAVAAVVAASAGVVCAGANCGQVFVDAVSGLLSEPFDPAEEAANDADYESCEVETGDPCDEWLEELLLVREDILAKYILGVIDEVTFQRLRRELNSAIDLFAQHCFHLRHLIRKI